MLDFTAVTSAGSTSLATIGTIAAGGDGQSVAGVPRKIGQKVTLAAWGAYTTIADTIKQVQMTCQDAIDPKNGENFNIGAGSILGLLHKDTNIDFLGSQRVIQMAQNTAGANNVGYYLDWYYSGTTQTGGYHRPGEVTVGQAFGALTAVTWGTVVFNPATLPPPGQYIILGAWVFGLTNYAALRFEHADFQGLKPGFPVLDALDLAVANAVVPKDPLLVYNGYQFVRLGEQLKQPACPQFTLGAQGTGLTIWALDITADTPTVILNIQQVSAGQPGTSSGGLG